MHLNRVLSLLAVLLMLFGATAATAGPNDSATSPIHLCACGDYHEFGETPTCPPYPPMRLGKLHICSAAGCRNVHADCRVPAYDDDLCPPLLPRSPKPRLDLRDAVLVVGVEASGSDPKKFNEYGHCKSHTCDGPDILRSCECGKCVRPCGCGDSKIGRGGSSKVGCRGSCCAEGDWELEKSPVRRLRKDVGEPGPKSLSAILNTLIAVASPADKPKPDKPTPDKPKPDKPKPDKSPTPDKPTPSPTPKDRPTPKPDGCSS
jgi:hypothetical protein